MTKFGQHKQFGGFTQLSLSVLCGAALSPNVPGQLPGLRQRSGSLAPRHCTDIVSTNGDVELSALVPQVPQFRRLASWVNIHQQIGTPQACSPGVQGARQIFPQFLQLCTSVNEWSVWLQLFSCAPITPLPAFAEPFSSAD